MSDLYEQVREVGTPRETKADVVDYYQQKFTGRGQAGWKQQLIHDVLGSQDITPSSVGDVEYNRLRKNMARRFDPSRINNPEPRNAEAYETLGEELPSMPPENGYHVWGTVWVKFSDGECEEREVDEYIQGEQADKLALASEESLAQRIVNSYMLEDDTDEPTAATYGCQEPELYVEAIE